MWNPIRKLLAKVGERQNQGQVNAEALQLGREAGAAMIAATNQFIEHEARPMAEGLWSIFASRLAEIEAADQLVEFTANGTDLTMSARTEAEDFVSALAEFHGRTAKEAAKQLKDWIETARDAGHEKALIAYIGDEIDELEREFRERCLEHTLARMKAVQTPG